MSLNSKKSKFYRVTTAYLHSGKVISAVTGSDYSPALPDCSFVSLRDRDIFSNWYYSYDTAADVARRENANQLLPYAM